MQLLSVSNVELSKHLCVVQELSLTGKQTAKTRMAHVAFELIRVSAKRNLKNIDNARLEIYLTDEEFVRVLGMERGEFYALPEWKQRNMKTKADLF
jgi:hypothetical protein